MDVTYSHSDSQSDDDQPRSRTGSFNSLPSNLSPVQTNEPRFFHTIQILAPLNLLVANRQNDFYVARVSLIGVNATMGTIRPSTGFLTENGNQ